MPTAAFTIKLNTALEALSASIENALRVYSSSRFMGLLCNRIQANTISIND